jgi:hypothetical protein
MDDSNETVEIGQHYKTETVDSPLLSTSGFMVGHSILECVGRQLIYDFWSIM